MYFFKEKFSHQIHCPFLLGKKKKKNIVCKHIIVKNTSIYYEKYFVKKIINIFFIAHTKYISVLSNSI